MPLANAALIALVAGVMGARLSHVLENLSDYTRSANNTFTTPANWEDAVLILESIGQP